MSEWTRPDSLSRRACLPLLAGAMASALQPPTQAQGASTAFEQWVDDLSRTRARARHLGRDLHAGDGRPQARHSRSTRSTARSPNSTSSSGSISIAASPTGASPTGKEKAKEYAALLARIEKDYGVDRCGHARAVGHRIGLRRSGRPEEPHAAGHPGARRARLGRAAPARLLGAGAAQRARHHRARLEHAAGDARLLGRRHGPHPMDAGGVAQCRRRLRRRRPRHRRSASPTTRSPAPRNISSSAASIGAASIGATRCAAGRQAGERASRSYEAWQKAGVARADGKPFPQPKATAQALGAGAGRAGLPARAEFLCRALLQSVDELHARRSCISATASRAAGRSCSSSPAASARRRWPSCRKSSSG